MHLTIEQYETYTDRGTKQTEYAIYDANGYLATDETCRSYVEAEAVRQRLLRDTAPERDDLTPSVAQ